MTKKVTLEALDANNWLKICDLSVSGEQKEIFPIPNVYWIGISRYEEKSELFAIKSGNEYIGLIGGGYDEDGITGYINPLMIDRRHQKNGYAKPAIMLIIKHLRDNLNVDAIKVNHRRENIIAGKIYDSLGFCVYNETDDEYQRQLKFSVYSAQQICEY